MPIGKVLEWRLPLDIQHVKDQGLTLNELQKLYTLDCLVKGLPSEPLFIVGLLKNVINVPARSTSRASAPKSLDSLANKYVADIESLTDTN